MFQRVGRHIGDEDAIGLGQCDYALMQFCEQTLGILNRA